MRRLQIKLKYVLLAVVPIAAVLALQVHAYRQASQFTHSVNRGDSEVMQRIAAKLGGDSEFSNAKLVDLEFGDVLLGRRRCQVQVWKLVDFDGCSLEIPDDDVVLNFGVFFE